MLTGVGYASASDVNMSVGSLTSVAYDTESIPQAVAISGLNFNVKPDLVMD